MVLLLDSWQVEGDEQSGMDCDFGKERPRVHQCRGHQHQGSTAMQMLVCLSVGCVYRKQLKVKSESEVTQSCLTVSDPMDCSPPGSSIRGIFQARALEWGAVGSS